MPNPHHQTRTALCLALLVAAAIPALAQTATGNSPAAASTASDSETVKLNEYVVSGLRASLASAQEIKQSNLQIVDSIVASDVNKLPDLDVSYALSRIPGIQVAHTFAGLGGNGAVTIHGLTQIANTLDGREIFTPGGASGGGIANGQRTFDYSQIPSALIAGIDVYKTSAANQLDGGLGGVVDVRLRKPFDFGDGIHAGVGVGTTYSSLENQTRPNYNLFFTDTAKTGIGKVGILVSGSYNVTPWREDNIGVGNPTPNTPPSNGPAGAVIANGYNLAASWGIFRTIGYNTELQWQPFERVQVYAGVNHNQWANIEEQSQLLIGLPAANVVPGSEILFPGSTVAVQSATFTNVTGSAYSDIRDLKDRSTMIYGGGKWTAGDLTLNLDVNHFVSAYSFSNNGVFGSVAIPSLTYDLHGTVPSATVSGASLYDPTNYKAGQVFNRLFPSTAKSSAGKLDADFNLNRGLFTHLLAGARYGQTEQDNSNLGLYLGSYNIPSTQSALSNYPGMWGPSPIQNFFNGYREAQPSQYLIHTNFSDFRNPAKLLQMYGDTTTTPQTDGTVNPLSLFQITEKTSALYLMPEFAGNVGSLPFDGNIGLRAVQTKEVLNGNQTVTPAAVSPTGKAIIGPIHLNSSYTDWLPSLNGRLKLSDKLFLRLAASKTITRPPFSSMSPSLTLNQNPINPLANSGSQGNPNLKPIRATNIDTSLEYYLSKDSVLYAAGFYKEVKGFIANSTQPQTYDGVLYQITTPSNLNPARIKGTEVGFHEFFTFLPAPFDGLGLQANFTYVQSSTPSTVQGYSIPLTNLSRTSYNVIAMYEKGPFSARVAYNWRNKFVTNVAQFVNVGLLPQFVRAYGDLDASLNYDLTKNLEVSVQGVNLTNAMRYQYWRSPQFPSNAYTDGMTLMASVTWKL